jgi:hypothetical protein
LAVLLAGFLIYRFYKNQIKDFFIRMITRLFNRLKTIRATEIFLILLTVVLIGMVSLMLGVSQDYLYSEFTEFNEIAEYMVHSVFYIRWMAGFLVFEQSFALGSIILLTLIHIWIKGRNRMLEYLLLIVSIFGAIPFRASIMEVFSFLRKFGFEERFHSSNFPDLNAMILIVIYGTCLFLLVRHSKNNFLTIVVPLLGLVILMGLVIINIALSNVLPSDIVGGYVYGGVWIFFNFLLFEMFRLVLEKY